MALAVAEPMGTWLRFSTPQATAESITPAAMRLEARLVACCEEPQWVSTVVAGTDSGRPAGDVEGLHADLADAAADDLADLGGVDAAALDQAVEHGAQEVSRVDGGQPPVAAPDGAAHGFDDDDFAFAHGGSLGQVCNDRSSRRGLPFGVIGELLTVPQRGSQGVAGLGHATATEGSGGLVEAPVPGGQTIVVFAGQEVELCFHVFILPRGCDSQTWSPGSRGKRQGEGRGR
jgi:hypothetical protein